MPIEIKELQISINVYGEDSEGINQEIDEIVEQCIEKLSAGITDKNER